MNDWVERHVLAILVIIICGGFAAGLGAYVTNENQREADRTEVARAHVAVLLQACEERNERDAQILAGVKVIARDGQAEIVIQRSRFLCTVTRVADVDAATAVIADVRRAGHDARHHCTALRIGDVGSGAATARSNDDGEPSGTAGVPMLEVLVRRELTDVVAVVSRWFGGVKLGAGGLVRAY